MTKGEFAILIGVSPGRVSQYLKEGRISAAAVDGEGRNARLRVERAKADLRVSLDVGQRFGNGLETRLDEAPVKSRAARQETELPIVSGIDREIKEQKLEQIRRANRAASITELMQRGKLVRADEAEAALAKVAGDMLRFFEGSFPEMASALAAQFNLPQRDVLHFLRKDFMVLRGRMAATCREKIAGMPEIVSTAIEMDDDDPETLN